MTTEPIKMPLKVAFSALDFSKSASYTPCREALHPPLGVTCCVIYPSLRLKCAKTLFRFRPLSDKSMAK
jgi:hypothetical protein